MTRYRHRLGFNCPQRNRNLEIRIVLFQVFAPQVFDRKPVQKRDCRQDISIGLTST
jgi:hypothetical protein